jgi:hypothetical protein
MTDALGEIVASDSQALEVECHKLYGAPAFGAFIRAECVGSGLRYYAVVTGATTQPVDGNRIVQAHKLAPGELEQRKPHLNTLLRTTFTARLVGYGNEGGQVCGTPPQPPRLHCFVYAASEAEIRALTGSPSFLRPLTQVLDMPLEDLLIAAIEAARAAWGGGAPLIAWGKYLARLLRTDYVTLESVLQRLAPAPLPPVVREKAGWEAPIPLTRNGTTQPAPPPHRHSPNPPHPSGGGYSAGVSDPFEDA